MKLSRLQGRKVNDYLRRRGHVWRGKTMTIRWLAEPPTFAKASAGKPKHPNIDPVRPAIYVGTAASVKLDKSAVKRNRMRRRCREAVRIAVLAHDKLPVFQLLITPRAASLTCTFNDIQNDVAAFFSQHI